MRFVPSMPPGRFPSGCLQQAFSFSSNLRQSRNRYLALSRLAHAQSRSNAGPSCISKSSRKARLTCRQNSSPPIITFSQLPLAQLASAFTPMNSAPVFFPRGPLSLDSRSSAKPAIGTVRGRFAHLHYHAMSGIIFAFLLISGALEIRATVAGKVDSEFAPYVDGYIQAVAVQPDGKILIAGQFTHVNGEPRNSLARLLPDGTVEDAATFAIGSGVNGSIQRIAIQPNGKILIAGGFSLVAGEP